MSTCTIPGSDAGEAQHEYGLDPRTRNPKPGTYDAIVLAVAHTQFVELGGERHPRASASRAACFSTSSSVLPRGRSGATLVYERNGETPCTSWSPAPPASSARHLAQRLLERGDEVIGFDNLNDYYDPDAEAGAAGAAHAACTVPASYAPRPGGPPGAGERLQRIPTAAGGQPGRAGRRALFAGKPARLHRQQHRRLHQHPRGLPAQRRRAPGVRLVQLGLRRQHASCRSRCTTRSTIRSASTPPPRRPTS